MLFETCRPDSQNRNTYFFQNPVKSLIAYDRASAEKALDDIEGLIQRKYWIAGYFSYELGYGFEMDSFPAEHKYNNPLLELYAFKKPEIQNASRNISSGRNKDFKASNIKFNIPYSQYKRNIGKIKRYIEKGDVYQINYTGKLKFKFKGDSFSFYRSLTEKQEVPYSAFLKLKNETVISLSPELFFSVKNGVIESKPMKGTMNRGRDLAEDTAKMKELRESSKNRAENIMITDLIRNDLGRICRTGSIHTSKIYEVIKYNTLLQMITTVRGRLSKGITWKEIFKSIFPGGSITGAPKIRAMQIIRELEKENRNIYCGALGFISPKNHAVFSVPIRTILLKNKTGEMGIGSGIVYDSGVKEEYAEALLKAKFLTEEPEDFKIIETILWARKYVLLGGHLRRLEKSAKYFNFILDLNNIKKQLKAKEKLLNGDNKHMVRLLLSKNGKVECLSSALTPRKNIKEKAVISSARVDSKNKYLYHKTTLRKLYEKEREKIKEKDIFDVIFLNEKKEVTEGAITNIFIEKKGKYYTPPVSSGLLPGVYREYLLKEKKAVQQILKIKDLKLADRIYLVNSVRGIVEVEIAF
ncbi:MAG: aminodeoxychorismate synthase, component I [Candidatus Firestonebacteria bacterium RIFOXYC2_FULL_39_67]|nr:MAG: aminodeoxychorismate synthase, component I [Candidatus Firestonebacteria bacterium RIFOXYD2_FULL_39_29]OGF54352.1 MAG: aminodeoxychorismate synthase, component I [Candidatus Firestonebacteria bacterium RIFOXYC2_FULL_39_67]OGF55556.1 MAG: aminodeoxychorismate synthase, component I [Candidatus Firestonebacteria bacterium RifOxyC12_full_39_7]